MNTSMDHFGELYSPIRAIVNYESTSGKKYFEYCDFSAKGVPINPHALSYKESAIFAKVLFDCSGFGQQFLKPKEILSPQVLHLTTGSRGQAIWHTPPTQERLLFSKFLKIPSGKYSLPGLIWKATAEKVILYAYKQSGRPSGDTPLFHAPFFNLYADGSVCTGDVKIEFSADCSLEDFITGWQRYFFDSYFSHVILDHQPVNGIVKMWQSLFAKDVDFPIELLKPAYINLNDLLS